ncbi:uncharacterized conserved protein [Sanguibacter keddieii DSM 10542]|uniref:Uncharacterized conserved protein n=1 Tax=Sanguibacter keddieii (strain ATCC 51767 / DSM 10542 / NCFB 3025 / ST-74) TaxID=446469 RepID=D1BFB4_SANKS|nr:LemA family protein [Sanguibacter keddieii]ACZ23417.1 uncharacterized conserved protein [Sanguibacter keddieii DSM 10542]
MIVALVLLGVLLLVAAGWVVATYNGFVSLRNLVQESWRQIDVELNRRHELVPNLVEAVQAYVVHERSVVDAVSAARAQALRQASGPAEQAAQESDLGRALGGLLAVAEAYPELRASAGFVELQRELATTEDRIAAARRFYDANVRALSTRLESFPSGVVGRGFGFQPAEYFALADPAARQVPVVDLGGGTRGAAG